MQLFRLNQNGRIDCYVGDRIKAGRKPIAFKLVSVEKVVNPILEARFDHCLQRLKAQGRSIADTTVRWGFHGSPSVVVRNICNKGLLRVGHSSGLNPSKAVDSGFFGMPQHGIYVSCHVDYTLKYANDMAPLASDEVVRVVMMRVLPGRSRKIEQRTPALKPSDSVGFDSHLSPMGQEWYLFDEAQCVPAYVLTVRAFEDNRTLEDEV